MNGSWNQKVIVGNIGGIEMGVKHLLLINRWTKLLVKQRTSTLEIHNAMKLKDLVGSGLIHTIIISCCSKSYRSQSLHHIGNNLNPYEQAVSIIGKTLAELNEDNLIPCYGLGDGSLGFLLRLINIVYSEILFTVPKFLHDFVVSVQQGHPEEADEEQKKGQSKCDISIYFHKETLLQLLGKVADLVVTCKMELWVS
ncbi:E3 ubiquitin-protein ligase RGLG1 [Artemisia annua]|uniref:E3 ubiquitin-protein ligase RGLG1 n=1 Tax=Artemisia annua TaxID=35608 RepID=A0A2U1NA52_ARTAN|nr:E3 ubiquitin-protein ligase RGLG1 [Artemisia annua]